MQVLIITHTHKRRRAAIDDVFYDSSGHLLIPPPPPLLSARHLTKYDSGVLQPSALILRQEGGSDERRVLLENGCTRARLTGATLMNRKLLEKRRVGILLQETAWVLICAGVLCLCAGSVSLGVFLVSLAVTVCAVWLVALCGVCGWCQRKLVSPQTHHQSVTAFII